MDKKKKHKIHRQKEKRKKRTLKCYPDSLIRHNMFKTKRIKHLKPPKPKIKNKRIKNKNHKLNLRTA